MRKQERERSEREEVSIVSYVNRKLCVVTGMTVVITEVAVIDTTT